MQNRLFLLIEEPKLLYGLSAISWLIITGLSFIPTLIDYLMYIGIYLLLIENFDTLKNVLRTDYRSGDPFIPLVLKYSFITIMVLSVFYALVRIVFRILVFQPYPIYIALIYFIIYYVWTTRIEGLYHGHRELTILKSQTTQSSYNFHITWRNFWFPTSLVVIISTLVIIFNIYVTRYIEDLMSIEVFFTMVVIFAFLVHLLVNSLVMGEFYWGLVEQPYIQYNQDYLLRSELYTAIPDLQEAMELTLYTKQISRAATPPVDFVNYLKENLTGLVMAAQSLTYYGFVFHLIHAMENWGERAKNIFLEYNLIVLSSFSRFRNFGLVEVYRRKLLFTYLLSMFKAGLAHPEMIEMLNYEIKKKNYQAIYEIGVALGLPYNKMIFGGKINPITSRIQIKIDPFRTWISIWQNKIYTGQNGYELLATELAAIEQKTIAQTQWEKDVWSLTVDYLKLFIGEASRNLFSVDSNVQEKLEHLARRNELCTFKDFKEILEEKREETFRSYEKRKSKQQSKPRKEYSKEEVNAIISSSLRTYRDERYTLKDNLRDVVKYLDKKKIAIFLLALTVNLGVLYVISSINQPLSIGLAVAEFFFILFSSMDIQEEKLTTLNAVEKRDRFGHIKVEYVSRTIWIIYSILFIIGYWLVYLISRT